MKSGYSVQGDSALIRRLTKYPELIDRTADSVLRQEARALCVSYGFASEPRGLQERSAVKMTQRVGSDVRKVFASRQSPATVYELLKVHAPHLANAYWHAHKKNKPRQMSAILTKANLPQGIQPADLKAARTGPGARVKKGQQPVSLATEAQLRAFVRKQQQLVGFAKAGWYAAAKALGGRVRSNTTASDGKRTTAEVFPGYVRKIASRFPGIGGATITPGRVEIFTSVRHAAAALTATNYATATDRARASLAAALAQSIRALNRTRSRSTSARAA